MPLVLTGIFTDIALVLYLQVTREAVQTAVSFRLEPLQQLHILVSTIALALYFPLLILGFKLYFRPERKMLRAAHARFAFAALFFRTLGFCLMFSMLK